MEENCLHEFVSHIDGKNATVRIFPDRIEWDRAGEVSRGKALLGASTFGLSLAKTGIRSSKGSTEMIPVKALTSVTTERDGLRQMKVKVIASGNTVDMRVSKDEALAIKDTLTRLILGTHPSQQAPSARASAPTPAPAPPPPAPAPAAADPAEQLKKLAGLRDSSLISDEEFEAKRREILDRL